MGTKKHGERPYPGLDKLNLDELQELLRQDFHASDDLDMDYTMAILEVIEKREQDNPDFKPADTEASWKNFEEKYMDKESDYLLLAHADNNFNIPPNITEINKIRRRGSGWKLRRTIAVAAVMILLLGLTTAQALGYDIFQSIARWTSEVFILGGSDSPREESSYLPQVSIEISPNMEFSSLQEALNYFNVNMPVIPKWYPDGFIQAQLTVIPFYESVLVSARYEKDSHTHTFSITMMIYTSQQENHIWFFEKDDNPVLIHETHEVRHYIMSNNDVMVSVWMNGNIEVSIQGDITQEELLKMIDSIYGG